MLDGTVRMLLRSDIAAGSSQAEIPLNRDYSTYDPVTSHIPTNWITRGAHTRPKLLSSQLPVVWSPTN